MYSDRSLLGQVTGPIYTQQYLAAALHKWRSANVWAADIPYKDFPQRYKDEIEFAAALMRMK